MMDMLASAEMLPQQQMKASPALIALNNMLVLSSTELQQLVTRELEENPALDQVESEQLCVTCGRPLSGNLCVYCLHEDDRLREARRSDVSDTPDDEFDPLVAVAAPVSLHESLRRDLHIALPERDHPIADYLVGCLDDQGYLDASVEEVADSLGVEVEQVERVLRRLQDIGPPGVGARNVQECLLLQIDRLERAGVCNPHVRQIVADYWQDLGEHRYSDIARALGISYDDVVAVRDFLRRYLRPFPLDVGDTAGNNTPVVLPDVIIHEDGGKLIVEVVESRQFSLCLNPFYQSLSQAVSAGQQEVTEAERQHMQTYISRARLFLTNLRQRRETIRRITEYLVERQEQFLRHGVRYLEPLTRAEVAAALGVHESTVSRATANKYVQLPNRALVPFSTFFHASLSVKDLIQELIAKEQSPLTDEQIVGVLRAHGYGLARRTVAKYRGQLGILPSHLR
ncbi:MAG TPA: RNA polymerase factor sigma-54 [Roseiflexaceae bacterium]|nr:RNA polymerase factor sigma-54 [Roseiflexaceae bacterium]